MRPRAGALGSNHIQMVNHQRQQRKAFLGSFREVAAESLDSYLRWFQQVGLEREAFPRSSLVASVAANAHVSLIEPI